MRVDGDYDDKNDGDDHHYTQMEEAVELTHRVKHRRDVCFSQVLPRQH